MEKAVSKLTVMFEEPFWIGIYERECHEKYEVCKVTFGAEPKDFEVYEYMLKNIDKLMFSPSLEAEAMVEKRINPKRIQRIINKQMKNTGVGTKAQQALKLQHEQRKREKTVRSRKQKEEEKERLFQMKQKKRKEKHKGH